MEQSSKRSAHNASMRASAAQPEAASQTTNAETNSRAPQSDVDDKGYRARVYEIVCRIPVGRVMTYGQIADLLGEGYTPRTVGYVMHAADESTVPWQRVINAQGACSTGRVILPPDKQQRLLEAEGIRFDARGRCDLNRFRWTPDEADQSTKDEQAQAQANLFAG